MKFRASIFAAMVIFSGSAPAYALSDENRPEYQKEYDAYLRDLQVIEQTGQAPQNPDLEADLNKMNSDEKILLTAPGKSTSLKIFFAQSNAEIMDSVEIVRIPKEFQQQYGDVHKDDSKIISASSLSDMQRQQRQKILADESTAKVAEHINPFRFLKEVQLTPQAGEYGTVELPLNPMVDAYFNQLGRPYVSASAASKESEKKPEKRQPFQRGLSLRNSMFVD